MRPSPVRYFSLFLLTQKISDFVVPILMLFAILFFLDFTLTELHYLVVAISGGGVLLFLAHTNRLYEEWRGTSLLKSLFLYVKVWIQTWLIIISFLFFLKLSDTFSRIVLTSWLIVTPLFIIGVKLSMRWTVSKIRSADRFHKKIAIAGAGDLGRLISSHMQDSPWLGCKVKAFYDDSLDLKGAVVDSVPVIGDLESLIEDAKSRRFTDIYITLPFRSEKKIKRLISELANTSCIVNFIPDIFNFELLQSKWTSLAGIPVFSVYDSPLDGIGRVIKRAEDIILSLCILVVILPFMFVIALMIKLTTTGPVIFKQKRYGIGGKEIIIWKFRTMSVCEDGDDIPQARKGDSRVTKIGSVLRRTSLDEFPQFFNVLQGDISLVGPRPHASAHNEYYKELIPGYMQRHLVKPGITGWAQINGWRGETSTLDKMEMRVKYDLDYIKRWSLWFDIRIILLTVIKGFRNNNAY